MKMLMKKSYNLKEAFQELFGNLMYNPYIVSLADKFNDYLDAAVPDGLLPEMIKFAAYDDDHFTYDDYIEEMLNEFYNRFYKYTAFSIYSDDELNDAKDDFAIRFLNALNVTYPKYRLIVKYYKDNQDNLMKGLTRQYRDDSGTSGSSTNRFNDTPQNGGDYSDDNHTTNINQIESESTSGLSHTEEYSNEYILDRINKISDDLKNVFLKWENEVGRILWMEV